MADIYHLVLTDPAGGTAHLTNRAATSHYGVPVLQITAADVDGDFGPADLLGFPPKLMRAADIVLAWATQPDRTDAERQAARLFLQQWPDGPQI